MPVVDFKTREPHDPGASFDPSGGGGDDGGMLARVAKLELIAEKTSERLAALERDVAIIKSNYSTRADVAEAKNSVIMWVVSAILLAQLLPTLLKALLP